MAAEMWGRRWITCDTSPVALAIARQRIATATFPYWQITGPADGAVRSADPARGFVYESIPRVSAAILAYDRQPDPVVLVDRPHRKRGVVRMSSPFTAESSSALVVSAVGQRSAAGRGAFPRRPCRVRPRGGGSAAGFARAGRRATGTQTCT